MLVTQLEFDASRDAELWPAIPAAPGVFLLRTALTNAEPYIGKTADLRRRLQRLLGPPSTQSRRMNLRDSIQSIEFTPTGSDFESGFLLYKLLRACFPESYSERLRLRFAPLVKLHMRNAYPRASVTTRIAHPRDSNQRSLYYGPFQSRTAAEKFADDSLDFFKLRRCVDDLHPDPAFPGCIYSEMKMCLAPCFQGCSDAEYRAEVTRVQEYFDSGGNSLLREFSTRREAASGSLDFEVAAALHAQVAKLKPLLSQLPEIVGRIDRLLALLVQPCAVKDAVTFFIVNHGIISGPIVFPIQPPDDGAMHSMEGRVSEVLANVSAVRPESAIEAMEHLAILSRWYYRSTRVGEVFFAESVSSGKPPVLPLRRVVRGIARVLRGEAAELPSQAQSTPAAESEAAPSEKTDASQ